MRTALAHVMARDDPPGNCVRLPVRRSLGWPTWLTVLLCGAIAGRVLAQADGSLRWASKMASTRGYVYSSPAVGADGTIFVGVEIDSTPQDGLLQAVNGKDGSIKWTFRTRQWVDSAPAIGADGTVYFGCWNGNLYAVNGATGLEKWKLSVGAIVISSPAVGPDGTLYIGSDDHGLHAVSKDGVERWKFLARNSIESSPAVAADGTI